MRAARPTGREADLTAVGVAAAIAVLPTLLREQGRARRAACAGARACRLCRSIAKTPSPARTTRASRQLTVRRTSSRGQRCRCRAEPCRHTHWSRTFTAAAIGEISWPRPFRPTRPGRAIGAARCFWSWSRRWLWPAVVWVGLELYGEAIDPPSTDQPAASTDQSADSFRADLCPSGRLRRRRRLQAQAPQRAGMDLDLGLALELAQLAVDRPPAASCAAT